MALYTFADLRNPKDTPTNKRKLYDDLIAAGLTQVQSWETGSVPSALVEVEANGLTEFQQAMKNEAESGSNELATGDALTVNSFQVYDNTALAGQQLVGRFLLTDVAGAGPFPLNYGRISFVYGGLVYTGVADPTNNATSGTLPQNSTAYVYAAASDVGSKFNASVGVITKFFQGALPGVTVTNPSDWLSAPGTQVGSDPEQVPAFRTRNRTKWATLGTGSPPAAYENWVRGASSQVTRVVVLTNIDLLDPGTVTVLIAGDSGALSPDVVLAAQNAVAKNQTGGSKIPTSAKAVVATTESNVIHVSGTVYVAGDVNTPEFQASIVGGSGTFKTFEKALAIGQLVSWERLLGCITQPAGTDPSVIPNIDSFLPNQDTPQLYDQTASFDLSGLVFVSVSS